MKLTIERRWIRKWCVMHNRPMDEWPQDVCDSWVHPDRRNPYDPDCRMELRVVPRERIGPL